MAYLARHINIRHILILAQQRQMQQNRQRGGIGSKDNELGRAAVQRLGSFIGTLLELPVVRRLLDEVKDVLSEGFIGDGPSYYFPFVSHRFF